MDENDIIGVVREYLEDKENSYALMLTGEWGCGKTYFVEHALTEKLEAGKNRHPVVVASAYGAKDLAELCGAIEAGSRLCWKWNRNTGITRQREPE